MGILLVLDAYNSAKLWPMLNNLTYKYYHKEDSQEAFLVLQGGNYKIESSFMTSIYDSLISKGKSVFTFNFPESNHDENSDDENDLSEAIDSLNGVVNYLHTEGNKKIYIVAKSLGAIVASRWLYKNPDEDVRMAVLGFVVGQIALDAIRGKLDLVIQGEHDSFGGPAVVEKHLSEHGVEAKILEIKGADHSYNNLNKEPQFQNLAVEILLENI